MRRSIFVVVVLAAIGVAVAGGISAVGSRSAPTQHSARSASDTSAQRLLAEIVARLQSPAIRSMTLGHAPPWFQPTADPSIPPLASFVGAPWLYATMAADDTYAAQAKAIWVAELAAGALRDEMRANGQKPIYSVDITLELSDGRTLHHAGAVIGDVRYGQGFSSAPDAVVEAHIRSAANAAGYDVDSIKILHADDQPAPAVELTASDPAKAVTDEGSLAHALFGAPGTYEGSYLAVIAHDGTPVLDQAAAFRVAVGLGWANPAFGAIPDSGGPPVPSTTN